MTHSCFTDTRVHDTKRKSNLTDSSFVALNSAQLYYPARFPPCPTPYIIVGCPVLSAYSFPSMQMDPLIRLMGVLI